MTLWKTLINYFLREKSCMYANLALGNFPSNCESRTVPLHPDVEMAMMCLGDEEQVDNFFSSGNPSSMRSSSSSNLPLEVITFSNAQ